ncbi:UNVERIFIED_CONTAM: hypothetical protein Scaly_2006600 [Sesamum calycinum]|uniref:Saposin B-type domain-containing protein n=1 Tax=Sesamum calycinum TaxID=2727403 RepID=A0AAW2N333_9LAMI
MAKSDQTLLLLVMCIGVIACSWMPTSYCAKKPVGVARKEDIPYIKCQVCEKLASQLYHQVQAKQAEISPKKISEYQIIEIAENVCNLKKKEADWILKIDIVEKGDRLEVLGYADTDVAEYLYKKKPQLDSLVNFICKDLTEACNSKPPPVPKDSRRTFVAKSEKEAEMERLLKSMEGMPGAPGMKMYSREDLMNQNFGGEDADDDDDDDDDDDEADLPKNLGKVLRQKDAKKYDWKERIVKGVQDAGEKLKGHADRVSNKIRRWWRSKKTSWEKGSKSGKAEL